MDDSEKRKPPLSGNSVDDLTAEALAILERRGFDVRGKTTAEIREIIKLPPKNKPK